MKKKNWFLKFFSTSFQFFSFFVAFVCKTVFWGKKKILFKKTHLHQKNRKFLVSYNIVIDANKNIDHYGRLQSIFGSTFLVQL